MFVRMANLPASLVSIAVVLLAMLVVGLLVVADRSVAPGTLGWRPIRPSAMHWTGFILSAGLALFMAYIWLFVGSSRPDGAQQMRILFWLILFFAGGSVLMGWATLQIRRAGIEWRGSIIALYRPKGACLKLSFDDIMSVRRDWLGRVVIRFADGTGTHLDRYAKGAEELIDALDAAGCLQHRQP
jgi:hypothetical protein